MLAIVCIVSFAVRPCAARISIQYQVNARPRINRLSGVKQLDPKKERRVVVRIAGVVVSGKSVTLATEGNPVNS